MAWAALPGGLSRELCRWVGAPEWAGGRRSLQLGLVATLPALLAALWAHCYPGTENSYLGAPLRASVQLCSPPPLSQDPLRDTQCLGLGGIPILGQDKHLLSLGATAGTPGPGTGASDRRDPIRPPPPASTLPEAKGPPASIQESAERAYPEAHSLWRDRIPPPLKTLPWLPHITDNKPGVSRSPHGPTRTQGLCAGSSCTDTPAGPKLLVATHQAGGGLA